MSSLLTYIIVLTVVAFLLGYSKKVVDPAGSLGLVIAILFAGGRYYVGTDFSVYVKGFIRNSKRSWSSFFNGDTEDFLFNAINKVTYGIGGRVFTWSVIMALTIIPIYIFIKKQFSDAVLFSVFSVFTLLCYTTAFNVSREFIAVAIVVFGIRFVFENKFKKFLICVAVAAMFHISALLSIVLWLFWSHKRNAPLSGRKNMFLILVTAFSAIAYQELISLVSSSFSAFKRYASLAQESGRGQNRDFYLNLAVLVVVLICYKKLKERDPRLVYMVSLLVVANLIGITGFTHPHVKRIAYYFDVPAQMVIFGYLPSCNLRLNKQTIVFLTYVYCVARFVLTAYILKQGNLIPYQFRLY